MKSIMEIIKQKWLLIVATTIVFYVALILISDVSEIFESFSKIRVELLLAIFFIGFASHIVKSLRQKQFLIMLEEKIPFYKNLLVYLAGLSLVATPGGIGVFLKSVYLKKGFQISAEKSFSVIFLERYHDLLAGTSIIFVGILFYFEWISALLVFFCSLLLAVLYVVLKNKRFFSFINAQVSKIKFLSEGLSNIEPGRSFAILTKPKNMATGWMLSVAGWSLDALAVYIVFLSLNVDLGYLLTSQIHFTALGYGVLSMLPAGIGVNEGMADFLLVRQGLELAVASSVVIMMRLSTVWFATIIGLVCTRIVLKQNIGTSHPQPT
ncbi:lysylphosphatidylglycerol synthase transmembrane domain-containing protein [Nitrosopumilus sp.]|uniref:lysylphosphatidylglycerol synthase transmembrane domain-containing protein n=1 Tax=Nitrosopumilus sp. TaxID=2024843 RepID=UPI00262A4607|nr:lysylphosphatidylglycerol synthase transmembrane domain-containing protein [Nitrosopumilus sp.]